jgi:hypothetical protein
MDELWLFISRFTLNCNYWNRDFGWIMTINLCIITQPTRSCRVSSLPTSLNKSCVWACICIWIVTLLSQNTYCHKTLIYSNN